MPTKQGDIALINHPVAQQLFQSTNRPKFAYNWTDGTPRVVPITCYWDGQEILIWSAPAAPKLKALRQNPTVALTIDRSEWPVQVLMVRGTVRVTMEASDTPEYLVMSQQYMGVEGGRAWVEQYRGMFAQHARITLRPEWVGVIDMETRFPSAIERAMESQYSGGGQ